MKTAFSIIECTLTAIGTWLLTRWAVTPTIRKRERHHLAAKLRKRADFQNPELAMILSREAYSLERQS